MVTVHQIKSWPKYFEATLHGEKTAEFRRNDRDYIEGDYLLMREWNPEKAEQKPYTGRYLLAKITHIMEPEEPWIGIPPGYIILSIKVLD